MAAVPSPFQISVLCWNIDGLDEREIDIRTLSVCDEINKNSPDVVMLQEVVDKSYSIIQCLCERYVCTSFKLENYYNILMVKKDKHLTINQNFDAIPFSNSEMGRYLLSQEITFHNQSIFIMTTHLESLKDYAEDRKEQLKDCFNRMLEKPNSACVIFGGDLNLREPELLSIGGIPNKIKDSWIDSGKSPDAKFTWNLKLNDNLSFGNVKPTARYDRLYYRSSDTKIMECQSFKLIGTERIAACGLFPSDHFGILSYYRLDSILK